jgi:3-methyl-2-oxobutanoate hydroxymethyltransferase
VLHDLLGLLGRFRPKFVKTYVNLEEIISKAVAQYLDEVRNRTFPDEAHAFS